MSCDDAGLAEKAQAGDLDAYGRLLRRYQPVAQRSAFFITGNREDAEDAVQDAFVKAWDALGGFDAKRPFRPWLLRIVSNAAYDRRRASGRRVRLTLRAATESRDERYEPSPERQVITDEQLRRVVEEINRLPEMDQVILSHRYFLEMTTAEIAEILGSPPGTVRSRLARTTQRLRERLAQDEQTVRDDASTWKRGQR